MLSLHEEEKVLREAFEFQKAVGVSLEYCCVPLGTESRVRVGSDGELSSEGSLRYCRLCAEWLHK